MGISGLKRKPNPSSCDCLVTKTKKISNQMMKFSEFSMFKVTSVQGISKALIHGNSNSFEKCCKLQSPI